VSSLSLDLLQRWMQTFIVHPGTEEQALAEAASHGIAVDNVSQVVLPSRALTSVERVGIYRGMYLLRLAEALEADYPGVHHFLGDQGFTDLVREYLEAYPSRSYSLNRLGDHLPEYIRSAPGLPRRAFLLDLARLELAVTEVFDAPETPALTTEQISAVPSEAWERARLTPIAAFRLLAFRYPVSDYLTSVKKEDHDHHPRARRKATWVGVFRKDYACTRLDLTRPGFELLESLASGVRLGEAIAAAVRRGKRRGATKPLKEDQLFRWFRDWVSGGVFRSVELDPA